MSTAVAKAVTPDDLLRMPDDGRVYELVNGELREKPVSKESGRAGVRVTRYLDEYADRQNSGWVYGPDTGFRCFAADPGRVRKPDAAFVSVARMPVETYEDEGYCTTVPDLVAEVISPNDLATEVEEKRDEWLAAGVQTVWIVHFEAQTVRVHRADGGIAFLRAADTLTAPDLLPGFAVPVAALFRRPSPADQWRCRMSTRTSKLPVLFVDTPVMFEDEGQEEMGESRPHNTATAILQYGLTAHFADRPGYTVCGDLNVYYHRTNRKAYVSPDVMVVNPTRPLARNARSYRIGRDRPPPLCVAEVLSDRTAQQGDLTLKPTIYADARVSEYLLFDPSGRHLPARLVLRVRVGDREWQDAPGSGVAVASRHGFTVAIDADDQLRVIDTATGHRYPRPDEANEIARSLAVTRSAREAEIVARAAAEAAQAAAERARVAAEAAQAAAEARVRELEAELARLRGTPPPSDE